MATSEPEPVVGEPVEAASLERETGAAETVEAADKDEDDGINRGAGPCCCDSRWALWEACLWLMYYEKAEIEVVPKKSPYWTLRDSEKVLFYQDTTVMGMFPADIQSEVVVTNARIIVSEWTWFKMFFREPLRFQQKVFGRKHVKGYESGQVKPNWKVLWLWIFMALVSAYGCVRGGDRMAHDIYYLLFSAIPDIYFAFGGCWNEEMWLRRDLNETLNKTNEALSDDRFHSLSKDAGIVARHWGGFGLHQDNIRTINRQSQRTVFNGAPASLLEQTENPAPLGRSTEQQLAYTIREDGQVLPELDRLPLLRTQGGASYLHNQATERSRLRHGHSSFGKLAKDRLTPGHAHTISRSPRKYGESQGQLLPETYGAFKTAQGQGPRDIDAHGQLAAVRFNEHHNFVSHEIDKPWEHFFATSGPAGGKKTRSATNQSAFLHHDKLRTGYQAGKGSFSNNPGSESKLEARPSSRPSTSKFTSMFETANIRHGHGQHQVPSIGQVVAGGLAGGNQELVNQVANQVLNKMQTASQDPQVASQAAGILSGQLKQNGYTGLGAAASLGSRYLNHSSSCKDMDGWQDTDGLACADYMDTSFAFTCTKQENREETAKRLNDDISKISPLLACCGCGGSSKSGRSAGVPELAKSLQSSISRVGIAEPPNAAQKFMDIARAIADSHQSAVMLKRLEAMPDSDVLALSGNLSLTQPFLEGEDSLVNPKFQALVYTVIENASMVEKWAAEPRDPVSEQSEEDVLESHLSSEHKALLHLIEFLAKSGSEVAWDILYRANPKYWDCIWRSFVRIWLLFCLLQIYLWHSKYMYYLTYMVLRADRDYYGELETTGWQGTSFAPARKSQIRRIRELHGFYLPNAKPWRMTALATVLNADLCEAEEVTLDADAGKLKLEGDEGLQTSVAA